MKWISGLFALLYLLFNSIPSLAGNRPLALVWNGPGACKPGCVDSAVTIARREGFRVLKVNPGFSDFARFKEATLWIHPGGKSTTAAGAMGAPLMDQVREFVRNGGGYVGFCAGAFISTAQIGTSGKTGFGLIPGSTEVLVKEGNDHRFFPVTTQNGVIKMYYAGGPFIKVSESDLKSVGGEVIARYEDGSIAGIRAHFGKGKVAVIGTHPEAGFTWKLLHGYLDLKGERFFAREMIRYAVSAK
jgi:glutamine amidotransferase-like uncharacterized protein